MLPTTTLQEVSWLYFFFFGLILLDLLAKRLRKLLFYQLLKIFLRTSNWSVIIKHLTIGFSLAGIGTKAYFDSFFRILLVKFEVCLAHTLDRSIIVHIFPLYVFSFHAADRLVIKVSNWLFSHLLDLDRPVNEVYIDALVFFYSV